MSLMSLNISKGSESSEGKLEGGEEEREDLSGREGGEEEGEAATDRGFAGKGQGG